MQGLFVSSGLRGLRYERLHAEQDLAVIRMAPALHQALFHIGVIGGGAFHKRLNGKNDFRMPGCEVPSTSRCPSLDNHGTALRGRGCVQRATRTKEPPHMVDTMDFCGIS